MATSEKPKLKLYSYWRSSCSWRVRIALQFKGLDYEYIPVNLLKGEQLSPGMKGSLGATVEQLSPGMKGSLGATVEQLSPEFQKLNPLGFVPVLVDEDMVLADSFAIIMYLEEKYPQHPLLPLDVQKKALNYQVANVVASSIQPLQNLAVLNYIEEKLGSDEKLSWGQNHVKRGFAALEKLLKGCAGKYATGDEIALADLFLAPQIGAAKRFSIDMAEFPELKRLNEAYSDIPAFRNAAPEKQPDAPDEVKST